MTGKKRHLLYFKKEITCQVYVRKWGKLQQIHVVCYLGSVFWSDKGFQFAIYEVHWQKVQGHCWHSTIHTVSSRRPAHMSDSISMGGGDCCIVNPYARRACHLLKHEAYGFAKAFWFQAIRLFISCFSFSRLLLSHSFPILNSSLFQHCPWSSNPPASAFPVLGLWVYSTSPKFISWFSDFKIEKKVF